MSKEMLVRARLRLRADWAVPANKVTMAACPITATVMWLAGRGGIVARQPLWLLSVAVAASFLLSTVTSARYDGRPTRGRLHERIAAQVLGTTFVMFLTGWGPLLVVGYPIISHELIAITGGRSWRAVLGWSLVGLCAGDAAIALGIAPTLIPEPAVYGLALLGGLGTLFVISTLGLSALRTEQAERSLRESELRLQRTIDTAIEAYVEIDGMGVVTAWNAQAELTLGWTADEAIGRPIDELVIPEERLESHRRGLEVLRDSSDLGSFAARAELTMSHRDGRELLMDASVWATATDDGPRFHSFLRDITEQKQFEQTLRESEESFRLMFANNPFPMWVFDVETLRFLHVNDAAVDKYGYSRDEFLGLTITDIRPDADRERLIEAVEMSGESVRHGGVWQHFTKSGETIDVEITSHRLQFAGRPGCLVMAQDVTDRLRAEQELAYQVMHDALTGLPNRTLLLDRLGQALGKLGRSDRRVGVLFVDLDRFKIVNDAAGHNVGDRLLIEVGARMQNAVRPGDTVARIGGDEFVVLLADVADRTDAAAVSGRIGWALDAPFVIGGSEFFVSASQGIALADAGDTPEEVLGRADAAMYTAKDRGGARSEFANAAVRVRARNRLSIESALRRAADQGEFVLHYQPVVELITGRIVGAEALVRWRPDGERLRSPDEFLAVAEDSGLIVPIGEWVIDRALSDAGAWAAEEPLGIAVNLSARQLSAPNLPFALARAISTSGVEPHRIHLEIAESVLMRDLERSVDRVSELREAGLQIHVDNVGAGYSSLASVRQLPVDAIKIDRSLVERLDDDHVDASMVTAVLDLSRSIGVGVVAVGVETAAQHALLRTIGCERAQGFWLARPMPVAEFVALLHAGPLPLAVEMRETEVS